MGDESCRKHERGIMQDESWKNPGGEPWKTYLGCTVMEETRKRSHAIVLEEGLWRRNHGRRKAGRASTEEES